MLTPYDEFPVHQSPHPFSYVPSTDYSWDDGYYFGVMSPAEKVFLAMGIRVNPNTDMIGGYALFNWAGKQYTVRFNRSWRREFALRVGPFSVDFIEPLKKLRIALAKNESDLEFDLLWEGVSPAYEEEHHVALRRGRATTDQTRYTQPGKASGFIRFRDKRFTVEPVGWSGARDHSWGLYAERAPLAPNPSLLPPKIIDGPQRALRFWTVFHSAPFSGFYHMHEDAHGRQVKMNDCFGVPFGGRLFEGWDEKPIELTAGRHEIEFEANGRIMKRARLFLTDSEGREWRQEIEVPTPPWVVTTMGYTPGSWKDGGTFFTYHGNEELAFEWDEFDFSKQPFKWKPYGMTGAEARDDFGFGYDLEKEIYGLEYLGDITTIAPDGRRGRGSGQIEFFLNGAYHPYGFK
jgi:hypothetical protein